MSPAMHQRLSESLPAKAKATDRPKGPGPRELVALMASLMALNALAIDSMLPALPFIGEALGIADPNRVQYIIGVYLLGMGVGSLFYGPLADRFGRKPVLLVSICLYVVFALICAITPSFDALLAARFAQGLSAAAMSVLVVSIIRDRFVGDAMASLMSMVFIIFMAVPVLAPTVGQIILYVAEWRAIFLMLAVMGTAVGLWLLMRLPETLAPENRLPIRPMVIVRTWKQVIFNRNAFGHVAGSGVAMGALYGFLNSSQQVFDKVFDAAAIFPYAFAAVAGAMAVSNWFNSRIVTRFGARRMSQSALIAFILLSLAQIGAGQMEHEPMLLFLALIALNMSMIGFIGANLGSIAMEPFGAMAGSASSFQTSFRTVLAASIGAAIGQAFDGTTLPLAYGFFFCGVTALSLVAWAERGRLFRRPGTAPRSPY